MKKGNLKIIGDGILYNYMCHGTKFVQSGGGYSRLITEIVKIEKQRTCFLFRTKEHFRPVLNDFFEGSKW